MRALKSILPVTAAMLVGAVLIACDRGTSENAPTETDPTAATVTEVSPEIAVLAHRLVFAYMSDKTWGFFGATCERWIEMDYEWDKSSSEMLEDGRVKVTYMRQPDRMLGAEQLIFYVDIDSRDVQGDNESETGRSGIAEGCDQW